VTERASYLGTTAIAGVGYTAFTRQSGRSVLDLATEACRTALDDAGLETVDGMGSFGFHGDSVASRAVASALGFKHLRWMSDLSAGGEIPCLLVMNAAMAVATSAADAVVVYRALNGRSGSRVGRVRDSGPGAQYRQPLGLTAWPQYQAMWARRFMLETGTTEEHLGAVATTQRRWAAHNDRAILRKPLSMDDYLSSPWLVEPFRVADCTTEVDGACALVVTSLERARSLRRPPAVIRGAAYAAGPRAGIDGADVFSWQDYSRSFLYHLRDELWSSARLAPHDVEFAEIYDCFSHVVPLGLEGLGLAKRGEGGAMVAAGETGPDGSLPVNTHGGLLCEGYLHGMNTIGEAVLQIQGRSGPRQLRRHDTAVVTSGALVDGSALVLTRDV
jgi:acetyl-CoA acetyltransferase